MTMALKRNWSIEQFLDWAGCQEGRFEFNGWQPVAMTGGNRRHSQLGINVLFALRSRLRGSRCSVYGPDLGVQTIGAAVRFPDALVTCANVPDADRLARDVRIVFEVISPSSGRVDRIEKLREYAAVASILRYVIVESAFPGLLVLHRKDALDPWTALTLTVEDTLDLPEVEAAVPVRELYEDVDFPPVVAEA